MATSPAPRRGPPAERMGSDRRRMLDVSREAHLKYDLRETLAGGSIPADKVGAFVATLLSKGARIGTGDAKDWVTSKMHEEVITKPERDAVNTLLDRYSKWR